MRKDLIREDDLYAENGDFVIADSRQQEAEVLMLMHKGEHKQHPATGLGVISYIKSVNAKRKLQRASEIEFQNDGISADIDVTDDLKFTIDI